MKRNLLLVIFTLLLTSCVTNLKKEQFLIDFSGEQIPVMISMVENPNKGKQYSFTSGSSSSVQTHVTRSSYGNTTTTTTNTEKYLSIKSQLAPLMILDSLQISIDSIKLTEDYLMGYAKSNEKTNLTISASIWSVK